VLVVPMFVVAKSKVHEYQDIVNVLFPTFNIYLMPESSLELASVIPAVFDTELLF
jgi:hypothetical protein